ncbi:MAG TPA: M48 family metalloprotease [Pyrinomonadaceae bacterium]|nr:M48 family metalloprotease [Pyrinomonadaceae bacterium]
MEEDKLASLIRPLESFAAARPGLYRLRVGLLAALGYLYLLLVVLLLLVLVAVTTFYVRLNWILIKVLWIPLALAGLVLRSLWITLPEPDGTRLTREQAPALFDLVNEVREALDGPTIHHVLISDDFNAFIAQIPQFGMFGWSRNYLVIGLPLLRALSPAEFRAVLAHEMGHLSGKHGRFSGWIYRLRQSWVEILTRVEQERHYASFLFEPFIKWYAPYLNAYSFVLARAQERHADEYSVELAGKEVAAVALVRSLEKERGLMVNFWPNFFRQAKEQPKAPPDPFVQFLGGLDQPIGPANTQKWFFEALRIPTGYVDTHPSLGDRLAAIGFAKEGPEVTALVEELLKADAEKQSAASYYLQEVPEDFLLRSNRLWRERIAHSWSQSHDELQKAQKRLDELDEQAKIRSLTLDERWERVTLLSKVEDDNAALPSIEAILRDNPEHARAHFAMGAILLEQQNPAGVEHLEKSMQLDPTTSGPACAMLSGFYFDQGNKALGESFSKRAAEHFEKQRKLQEQVMNFSAGDRFLPHGLDEEAVTRLQNALKNVHGLSEAYLVRKVLEDSDMSPYVLAVVAGFTWRNGQSAKHVGALFDELMKVKDVPEQIVFLSLDGEHGYLLHTMRSIPGAQLFATADAALTYLN